MVKKIFLIMLNSLALGTFLPVALCVFVLSSRVRNGFRISRDRLVKYVPSCEVEELLRALEIAEDHRYRMHWGIDLIAIVRAIASVATGGRLQGASTIEQQYVRTCTERRELSIIRKCEEASIAILLSLSTSKDRIAYSYLSCAYFGEGLCGYKAAVSVLPAEEYGESHTSWGAASIVALLKRPRPTSGHSRWMSAHSNRVKYIIRRQSLANNNDSSQRTLISASDCKR